MMNKKKVVESTPKIKTETKKKKKNCGCGKKTTK